MASANGNRVGHWWANVNAWVVSENATQATIRVECRFQSDPWGYNVWAGNSTSVTCDGQSSGTQGYGTISVGYGVAANVLTISRDFTVAKAAGGRNVWCTATFTLGGYEPGTSSAGVSVWTNGISYSAPTSPSNLAAARVSDASASLTWSNGGTSTTQPRSATLVERRTDEGAWAQIASVGGSAANYTDNGISSNHRYEYRVRAQGAGGYSGYAAAPDPVYTTPAAPSSVVASKSSASVVTLSIEGAAPYAESYDIERSTDAGSSWDTAGTAQSFPWSDTSAPAGTVVYRVRAVRGELRSAWSESNSITTITPPLAPTVTGVPSVVATGTPVRVSWIPNHPDNSDQTQAQVEYTVGEGEPQTIDVSGQGTSAVIPAQSRPATVRVRVRTHGLDPDWGEWSAYRTMRVYYPPSVAITAPGVDGAGIGSVPVTFEWVASDSTGVSSQTVVLSGQSGSIMRALDGSARELTLGTADFPFVNLQDYTLTVTVNGGSGLSSTAVRHFGINYVTPSVPDAEIVVDDRLAAEVTVVPGPSGSETGREITVRGQEGAQMPGFTVYGSSETAALGSIVIEVSADGSDDPSTVEIDLDGHALTAASDGTADEVSVDENGAVVLTQRVGEGGAVLEEPVTVDLPGVSVPTYPADEVTVRVGEQGIADVRVDYTPAESFAVMRVLDGYLWEVGSGLLGLQQATDPLPPLNVGFQYMIVATAASGAQSQRLVDVTVDSKGRAALNFGQAAAEALVTQFDFTMSDGYSHGGELLHFATDDGLPLFYGTSDVDNAGSYGFTLLFEDAVAAARDLFRRYAVCWLRTPDGRRQRCRAGASFDADNRFPMCTVSLDTDEIQWGEAW